MQRWHHGQLIRRREILGYSPIAEHYDQPWADASWFEIPVYVVEDSDDALVTYIATGARYHLPSGGWPSADGRHPWHAADRWHGHGCLMVQRPGEHHAVWHFWDGPDREFRYWYLNLQTAFRRTTAGYDSQDLEADLIVFPDGSHQLKDMELLDERVAEGRYSAELVEWIRDYVGDLVGRLTGGERWWDQSWADWEPPSDWVDPALPA